MIFDSQTSRYVNRCVESIETGWLSSDSLLFTCPECGRTMDRTSHYEHVVCQVGDQLAVIVACEDYWCINPELVGLPRGNWTSPDSMLG